MLLVVSPIPPGWQLCDRAAENARRAHGNRAPFPVNHV